MSDTDAATERLSREPIGLPLAERVTARLVKDAGRKGVWNSHRDYCGHGLIYLAPEFRLVEVHDGQAAEGRVLSVWTSDSGFSAWLAGQSDFTLSGADAREPLLHTAVPARLNNQRLTRNRLQAYADGREVLPAFQDYLAILDSALFFLIEEFGFTASPAEMFGRECVVVYRRDDQAAIQVMSEPFRTPYLEVSLSGSTPEESLSSQSLISLARQRAPDWQPPRFGRDAQPNGSNLFECFADYETLLRSHFMDVLAPAQAPDSQPSKRSGAARVRIIACLLVVASFLAMILELRYLFAAGTPQATGSVRANLGMLLLMSLPWLVLAASLLQFISGVPIYRYGSAFSSEPLGRRIGLALVAIGGAILVTWMAVVVA